MLQPGWQNLRSGSIWKSSFKDVQFFRFEEKMQNTNGGNHANPVSSSTSSHPMFTWPPCQCGLTPQTSGLTPHLRETPRHTRKSPRDPPLASGTSWHLQLIVSWISCACHLCLHGSDRSFCQDLPSIKAITEEGSQRVVIIWGTERLALWNIKDGGVKCANLAPSSLACLQHWRYLQSHRAWPSSEDTVLNTSDTCHLKICAVLQNLQSFFMPSLTRPEKWELDDTCNSFQ